MNVSRIEEIAEGQGPAWVHASSVMVHGQALVLFGQSGSGKSGLALQLMALGATLIADDRTILTRHEEQIIASCPKTITGRIEARGVGILRAEVAHDAPVVAFVDMECAETQRLPDPRALTVFGLHIPVLQKVEEGYFPAALMQYLSQGIAEG
ncbi:HPr kinase/phosphorylase [Donghicola sp. XS_ASV15]|uniref:HPr kinase/phosphorylase n=1 Tax=Donghicola sp. XS_ASV15 TaxID=3241295 RepID=UPI003513BF04